MASRRNHYEIIDEPSVKPWGEKLIVEPVVILLAAILVPLVWQPPFAGRYWMPLVWLAVNGLALGSSTLGREIAVLVAGAVIWIALFLGASQVLERGIVPFQPADVYPYLRIVLFAVFFMTLYLAVFMQSRSYQLYAYTRGDDR